jgi:glutamate--cysteine ligase
VSAIAELLDGIYQSDVHTNATRAQQAKVQDPEKTPSAKILQRMRELDTPYFVFAMNQSLANSDYFRSLALDDDTMATLKTLTETSNQDRQAIEETDDVDFDTYLARTNAS